MRKTIQERFLEKVNKTETCWIWNAGFKKKEAGYGCFRIGDKNLMSHRVSYELFVGPITDGLYVCHKCDNPKCVNPNHLFLGDAKDNFQDAMKKGRMIHKPKIHPSLASYVKDKCRCEECRSLMSIWHRENYKKNRDKQKQQLQLV